MATHHQHAALHPAQRKTSVTAHDEYNATIVRRLEIHDHLNIFWIRPDGGVVPPFQAGQFFSIGRRIEPDEHEGVKTKLLKRAYSIASSPREKDALEIFIALVDDGAFTPWLWKQDVGSRLWLSPKPAGKFTMEGFEAGKDLVLVSTGTGLSPFLSMFRTFRDHPPWRRIVILNGVRHARDLGYDRELAAAAAKDANLIYIPMASRERDDSGWPGMRGRVTEALKDDVYERLVGTPFDPAECHVFLCGNPGMIDELERKLTQRGFTKHSRQKPGTLHLERYW